MKRYIKCMGYDNPANIKPAHNTFNPSLQHAEFVRLAKLADKSSNSLLLDGLVQAVINDINADNKAGKVSNQDIRNYYRKYYDAVVNLKSKGVNVALLNTLSTLV